MSTPLRSVGTAILFAALAACNKVTETDPVPASLTLVQGGQQQVQAGFELPTPIVVRVLDVDGKPVEKLSVGFVISRGGGSVSPGSALTDVNGEVKTKWTLGPNDVTQTLRASVAGLEPILVDAVGIVPTDLVVAQGASQTAKSGSALPNPIVVRVVGGNNVPMKGIPVAFQIAAGGGLISPQSGVTNASGEVLTRWTLGPNAGINTLVVQAGSLQAVTIQAVGQ